MKYLLGEKKMCWKILYYHKIICIEVVKKIKQMFWHFFICFVSLALFENPKSEKSTKDHC